MQKRCSLILSLKVETKPSFPASQGESMVWIEVTAWLPAEKDFLLQDSILLVQVLIINLTAVKSTAHLYNKAFLWLKPTYTKRSEFKNNLPEHVFLRQMGFFNFVISRYLGTRFPDLIQKSMKISLIQFSKSASIFSEENVFPATLSTPYNPSAWKSFITVYRTVL